MVWGPCVRTRVDEHRPMALFTASFARRLLGRHRALVSSLAGTTHQLQRQPASIVASSGNGNGNGNGALGTATFASMAQTPRPHDAAMVFPPPPPAPSQDAPAWADGIWASPVDVRRRVFCNRSLNMKSIRAVGFDMDYTLAQYRPETFEHLAHKLTLDNLVKVFGYPEMLQKFKFDWRYMVRGLTIDKKRGNVLKIDRHKYVKLAYHGFTPLTRDKRLATYSNVAGRFEFDEPDFALIDTLFSLAEAHLFMQLVELMDALPHALPPGKTYADLYKDVRAAVDLCHRDGSLKKAVAKDPAMYIHQDPQLAVLLDLQRASGRRLFLATNSLWDYTHVVMNFLLTGRTGDAKTCDWLDYFDVVITGCGKPAFFESRKPIFEVDPATGWLRNTDEGTPMVPIGEADLPRADLASSVPRGLAAVHAASRGAPPARARVFQGGTYTDLHKMLDIRSGSEVLYVGDHIYGDILRSKKTLGWRTCLVVPELETELAILGNNKDTMEELRLLRKERDALDDQIQRMQWALRCAAASSTSSSSEDSSDEDEEESAAGSAQPAGAADRSTDLSDPSSTSSSAGDSESASSSGAGGEEGAAPDAYNVAELCTTSAVDDVGDDPDKWLAAIDNLKQQRDQVREKHRLLLKAHHEKFHSIWGQLLKTGYQNSRFAHQVERFACIYTSHVANLVYYSPDKSYRARQDFMAHEAEPYA